MGVTLSVRCVRTCFLLPHCTKFEKNMKPLILALISLFFFASSCTATTLVGKEKCTWGPSYWCSHIKLAKECGTIEHCAANVWAKTPANQGDSLCDDCKESLDEVKKMLDKATIGDIITFLETNICNTLPDDLKAMCKETVETYINEIVDLINNTDSSVACAAIGFCGDAHILEKEAKNVLDNFNEMNGVTKLKQQNVKVTVECAICEFVMQEVDELLKENSTEKEIEQALDEVCSLLPSTVRSECDTLIQTYGPVIYQLLINEISPDIVCTALTLCNLTSSVPSNKPVHITHKDQCAKGPTYWCSDLTKANKCNAVNHCTQTIWSNQPVQDDVECGLCKGMVDVVRQAILNNETEEAILEFIDQVCSMMPNSELQQICYTAINATVKEVFRLILSDLDSSKVCLAIGLCSPTIRALDTKPKPKVGDVQCSDCVKYISIVKKMIENNETKEELIKTLDLYCEAFGDLSATCQEYVMQFLPEIFDAIKKFTPEVVCKEIGFCPSITIHHLKALPPTPKVVPMMEMKAAVSLKKSHAKLSSVKCIVCEFIAKELEGLLTTNSTEKEIINAVEKVCSLLPESLSEECNSIITEYGPAILSLLEQELNPSLLCTKIGLCDSLTSVKVPMANDEMCDVCELAVKYLDTTLSDNATQQEIEKALENICSILGDLKDQCDQLIETYGATLFILLKQLLEPQLVCEFLGLCTSAEMANVDICQLGPGYQCASMENALKCQMVDFCMNKFWVNL